MADMWDLGRYVEDHPEAYDQRWRLAKKLYLACEYRLALEHLQVLRNEWVRKLNVVRYLAAAYYRLGRYDESIAELEEGIEVWPDEVGLREQLARVLEAAGRQTEASAVWDQIVRIDPEHPLARNASDRLVSPHGDTAQDDLHIQESDSGIDLAPKWLCPNCGAQNSVDFDRCWQCRAPLATGAPEQALGAPAQPAAPVAKAEQAGANTLQRTLTILGSVLLVAMLAYGIYLGVTELPSSQPVSPDIIVPSTVYGELLMSLLYARLVLSLVLVVVWPIVLFVSSGHVRSDQPSPGVIVIAGVLLAALASAIAWAPLHTVPQLLMLLAPMSFLIIYCLFQITVRDSLIIWLTQLLIIPLAAAGGWAAVEGPSAVLQAPAFISYAAAHDSAVQPKVRYDAPPSAVTAQYGITWKSSGSSWLDRKLATAQFELKHSVPGRPLSFDLKDPKTTVVFEKVTGSPFRAHSPVEAGVAYVLSVRGDPEQFGAPINLTVYSLLEPTFSAVQQ